MVLESLPSESWTFDWVSRLFYNSTPTWFAYPNTSPSEMSSSNDSFETVFGAETAPVLDAPRRPTDSYFSMTTSRRTSFSSNTSSDMPVTPDIGTFSRPTLQHTVGRPATTALPASSASGSSMPKVVAVDALSRNFPAPKEDASLDEMLARPPQKWSVGHYVKNAREARAPVEDKDERAKAFEKAKKELLAAKASLDGSR